MRKKFVVSLFMSMSLILTSCGALDASLGAEEVSEKNEKSETKENTTVVVEEDETAKASSAKDNEEENQKDISVISHKLSAEFADNEGLVSTGSYPEIVVNEEFMMEYPKLWAAMVNYSDSIAESTIQDIKCFGYGSPEDENSTYHYDISAEVVRLDDKLFTAKVTEEYDWSYADDNAPYYYYVNYDINSGRRIWSDSFFAQKEGVGQLLYDAVVAAYPREKDLVNETTEEGVSVALDAINSMVEYDYLPCCIIGDEFIVHFDAYSIMNNDNEYDITIPVDDIKDYINSDYIDDTTGDLDELVEYTEVIDDAVEGELYEYDDGEPDYEEQEEIHVSTPEELIDAIAPNRHIVVEAGKYDITDYVLTPTDKFLEDHAYWGYSSWWGEYGVCNVYNMTIEGEDANDRPEIVINSPYYDVFVLNGCKDVTLNNLIIGHDAQKGECSANVLALYSSSGISGTNLDLYGCGAYGLYCSACTGVYIYDSCIHDCTYGITMIMEDSTDIYFYNSEFINNKEYTLIENSYNTGYIFFTECTFKDNEGDLFSTYGEPGYITFTDCEFGDAEREYLDENFDMVNYYEDGAAG
ncbi:MAG: right-handed parallel beta-helix repeat-containing protein [Butyrivibrio sp.]|uniref:right-handed parallel beta-helix repeat-containing protein n=1 Tax=Butyrivibrio sp. TaxID=28121 RepID=UPI0025CE23BB|nr:right-handed parallel beta-helix repeat-containing protein [Butyrivibrio sp.]MCR5773254.1 right-handed parallel beta-helix repeat-containing protein [Butyrivibrio sp.]